MKLVWERGGGNRRRIWLGVAIVPIDAKAYSRGGYGVERDAEIKSLKKGLVFFY